MAKIDTRVYQKVRQQEKARRKKQLKSKKVKVITGDDAGPKISFEQYWMKLSKRLPVRSWLKEILWADFKARGITESETEEKYDSAAKLFGLKLD